MIFSCSFPFCTPLVRGVLEIKQRHKRDRGRKKASSSLNYVTRIRFLLKNEILPKFIEIFHVAIPFGNYELNRFANRCYKLVKNMLRLLRKSHLKHPSLKPWRSFRTTEHVLCWRIRTRKLLFRKPTKI